jgi:hypothetical protein
MQEIACLARSQGYARLEEMSLPRASCHPGPLRAEVAAYLPRELRFYVVGASARM